MADQPNINNVQRGIRCNRELDAKVLKMFRVSDDMTVKDAYILALQFATRDVVLGPEDYERIRQDILEAREKLSLNIKRKARNRK